MRKISFRLLAIFAGVLTSCCCSLMYPIIIGEQNEIIITKEFVPDLIKITISCTFACWLVVRTSRWRRN